MSIFDLDLGRMSVQRDLQLHKYTIIQGNNNSTSNTVRAYSRRRYNLSKHEQVHRAVARFVSELAELNMALC